jgi:hypothetical protein
MITLTGHFDGSLVLDEPEPKSSRSDVIVCFLEPEDRRSEVLMRITGRFYPRDEYEREQLDRAKEEAEARWAEEEEDYDIDDFMEGLSRNRRDEGRTAMCGDKADIPVSEALPSLIQGEYRDGIVMLPEVPQFANVSKALVVFFPRAGLCSQQQADLRWEIGAKLEEWYDEARGRPVRDY